MSSSNIDLIKTYFEGLKKRNFFGTIEITLHGGELGYVRELQSKQDFEIAIECLDNANQDEKENILNKFRGHNKFLDLYTKKYGKMY